MVGGAQYRKYISNLEEVQMFHWGLPVYQCQGLQGLVPLLQVLLGALSQRQLKKMKKVQSF